MVETDKEKTDRQLSELLNELRVALPGAQVLLAFLLTAPLQSHFTRTTEFQRSLLFTGVVLTGAGVLLLMAPSVYHRVRWNRGGKEDVVRVGHALFLTGTGSLALGMFCAVFVAADTLLDLTAAIAALVTLFAIVAFTWYLLPIRRTRDPRVRASE